MNRSLPPSTLDDDCLWEILLRLPPQPSSLPRASLVCKRWRRLVTNPQFLRRFSAHHRKPPLLGFFSGHQAVFFAPALDPPDWIPAPRFSLRPAHGDRFQFLDFRHGRALILNHTQPPQVLVWDPVTGEQRRFAVPPAFSAASETTIVNGAVLCAHLHGDCRSSPFKVVLGAADAGYTHAFTRVYSSETGVWGDAFSLPLLDSHHIRISRDVRNYHDMRNYQRKTTPMVSVGDSLYWLLTSWLHMGNYWSAILDIDLERQSIAVVQPPPDLNGHRNCTFTIVPGDDASLGLILVSNFSARLFNRRVYCHGGATWVLRRIVQIDQLLSLGSAAKEEPLTLVGFAEQNSVMLVRTCHHVFMVYLRSMRFKKLCHSGTAQHYFYHAFESFYSAGNGIGDGHGEAEVLHNM